MNMKIEKIYFQKLRFIEKHIFELKTYTCYENNMQRSRNRDALFLLPFVASTVALCLIDDNENEGALAQNNVQHVI